MSLDICGTDDWELLKWLKNRIYLNYSDTRPVDSYPYRAGPAVRQFEKDEIYKMTKIGVIEPAQIERESPILFAPEKHEALILCVAYRKPNGLTVRDVYPIPPM